MERVERAEEFLAAPLGRMFVGRRHVVFHPREGLLGYASFGRPDAEDVRELLALAAVGLRADVAPHRFLVDLRALESIDPSTFGPFVEYTRVHRAVLAEKVLRQAQLRPEGIVGAIIAGFAPIARLPYPERVFADVDDALGWLGLPAAEGRAVLEEVRAAREGAQARATIVGQVRALLAERGVLPLAALAKALAVAPRSLQRALAEAGTSYRSEVAAARVRRAEGLLLGDRPLAWVAEAAGFAGVPHFTTAFRRATGETPGAYRERRRAVGASV